jgi:hypothetical protein
MYLDRPGANVFFSAELDREYRMTSASILTTHPLPMAEPFYRAASEQSAQSLERNLTEMQPASAAGAGQRDTCSVREDKVQEVINNRGIGDFLAPDRGVSMFHRTYSGAVNFYQRKTIIRTDAVRLLRAHLVTPARDSNSLTGSNPTAAFRFSAESRTSGLPVV